VVRDEVAGQEENPDASEMANEGMALPALEESAREHFAAGVAADLQPLRERLAALLQIQDDNHFAQRVKDFTTELEGLQSDMLALPKCAQVLAETQIAALFNGIAEGVKTHKSELSKRHEN